MPVAIFQQGKGLKPVNYVKKRVVFDSCWEIGSRELETYEEQIIFSKSAAWDYENEFRQSFMLSSPSLITRPVKKVSGYFLPLPPEAIVSVTLGPRCSTQLDNKVRKILQKPSLCHVKLDRAALHKGDFLVEFE
jgi:hypothetical protein